MRFFPEPLKLDSIPAGPSNPQPSDDPFSSTFRASSVASTSSTRSLSTKKQSKAKGKAVAYTERKRLDETHLSQRINSTLRLRSAWQDIAQRYSAPLPSASHILPIGRMRALREDDDDVIDLETLSIVQDRGVIRNAKPGSFAIGSWWSAEPLPSPRPPPARRASTSSSPTKRKRTSLTVSDRRRVVMSDSESDDEYIGPSKGIRKSQSEGIVRRRQQRRNDSSDDEDLPWEVASDPDDVLGSWIDLPSSASLKHSDQMRKRLDDRSTLRRFRQEESMIRRESETPRPSSSSSMRMADQESASDDEEEGTTFLPEPSAAPDSDPEDELAIQPATTPPKAPLQRTSSLKPSPLKNVITLPPSPQSSAEPEMLVMDPPGPSAIPRSFSLGPFSLLRRSPSMSPAVAPRPSPAFELPVQQRGLQTPPNSKEVDVEVFKKPFLPASATRRLSKSSPVATRPHSLSPARPIPPLPAVSNATPASLSPAPAAPASPPARRMSTRASSVRLSDPGPRRPVAAAPKSPVAPARRSLSPSKSRSTSPTKRPRDASTSASGTTQFPTGDKRHRTANEILPVPIAMPESLRMRSESVSPLVRARARASASVAPFVGMVRSSSRALQNVSMLANDERESTAVEDDEAMEGEDELLLMSTPSPVTSLTSSPLSSAQSSPTKSAPEQQQYRRRMMSVTPSPSERMRRLNLASSSSSASIGRAERVYSEMPTSRSFVSIGKDAAVTLGNEERTRTPSVTPSRLRRPSVLRETPMRELPPGADELGI